MSEKERFECSKCGNQSAYIEEVREYTLKTSCPICGFRTFLKPGPVAVKSKEEALPCDKVTEGLGARSFRNGEAITACPYISSSESFTWWMKGYCDEQGRKEEAVALVWGSKGPITEISGVKFSYDCAGGCIIAPATNKDWHLYFKKEQIKEIVEFWRSCGAEV